MVEMMSSAYSDDGQRSRLRRNDDLNALQMPMAEPDTGVSITAQLSDHRIRGLERPDEDEVEDPIAELPNESENASSPPGSIGGNEQHDIMSENIKSMKLHKFGLSHNKPFTVK